MELCRQAELKANRQGFGVVCSSSWTQCVLSDQGIWKVEGNYLEHLREPGWIQGGKIKKKEKEKEKEGKGKERTGWRDFGRGKGRGRGDD